MLYGHDQGKNIKQLSDDTNDVVCAKMGGTGKASHTANAVLTGNGEDAVKNVATANGALYATAANGAPKFGTLPIAQGGTGATTIADAKNKLGLKYTGVAASVRGSVASVSLAASTLKLVDCDTFISKTDDAFTLTSAGGLVMPYTGVVEVSGTVYISGSGAQIGCYLKKGTTTANAVEITSQYVGANGNGAVTSGRLIIPVNAKDVIYMYARSSVAGTFAPNNNATHLDVCYIK